MLLPAPDGPTIAVSVPGSQLNDIPRSTSPLSTNSGLAAASNEAREISSALGYAKKTFSNAIAGIALEILLGFALSLTIGSRSKTSKTRSNETKADITSTRIFESAVSGP